MTKVRLFFTIIILCMFIQPVHAIRIGLITGVGKLNVGASTYANIIDVKTNKVLYTIDPMRNYIFKPYGNSIVIKVAGNYYTLNSDEVIIRPINQGFVSAKNKWYRGTFVIRNINEHLTLINKLDMESYIQGVVPAEMPSSWEYEAHKAQAIAARSYAAANMGKRAKYGYDLKDTPEDQAYNGASAETKQTNKAVKDSYGIVLIYGLKVIPAYYSASAGGQSKTWEKDLPYIHSVPSFDDGIKKNGHGVGMSQHGANNLAKQGYNAYQILKYFYTNIRFAKIKQDFYD